LRRVVVLIGAALVGLLANPLLGQSRCGPVGEQMIFACLRGVEGPTIVLAAGAGQDSRTWAPLVEELAAVGRVVSFDRPGLGQSPTVAGPRTPTAIAHEIQALLTALDLSGPMVLVGHSMGGIHALRYADLYPETVAGVVLLDAPPAGFEDERMALLSAEEQGLRQAALEEGRSRAPGVVGRERDGAAAEPWSFERFPRDRPLVVVVADSQYFGELGSGEAHRTLWMRLSEQWLSLSDRSQLVVAPGSGHMIHQERPGLVLDVIRTLVADAAQGGS
jgi:pimeloyl-ACP methyl ester carboxylesterase